MACAATLQDELEAFIGDYQQREQSHADNHWILKPVCRIGGSLSNPVPRLRRPVDDPCLLLLLLLLLLPPSLQPDEPVAQ